LRILVGLVAAAAAAAAAATASLLSETLTPDLASSHPDSRTEIRAQPRSPFIPREG